MPSVGNWTQVGAQLLDGLGTFPRLNNSNFSLRWSMDDSNSGMVQVPRSLLTLDLISSFSPPLIRIRFLKCLPTPLEEGNQMVPMEGEFVDHSDLNVMIAFKQ